MLFKQQKIESSIKKNPCAFKLEMKFIFSHFEKKYFRNRRDCSSKEAISQHEKESMTEGKP